MVGCGGCSGTMTKAWNYVMALQENCIMIFFRNGFQLRETNNKLSSSKIFSENVDYASLIFACVCEKGG
jgi:hypothetical protein